MAAKSDKKRKLGEKPAHSSKKNRNGPKTRPSLEKDEEELALEKLVFGDIDGFESSLRHLDLDSYLEEMNQQNMMHELGTTDESDDDDGDDEQEDEEDLAALDDAQLFMMDDPNADGGEEKENSSDKDSDSDEDDSSSSSDESDDPNDILDVNGGHAAWIDSDDERLQISLVDNSRLKKLRKSISEDYVSGKEYAKRLRSRFEKVYPVPEWAKEPDSSNEDSDDDVDMYSDDDDEGKSGKVGADPLSQLLQTSARYVSRKKTKLLPPTMLDIERLSDANQTALSLAVIQSLHFHPTHPLLLSSGFDQTLRIYHIDGKKNPLVSSLHVRRLPFKTAVFHPDGIRVLAGGARKTFRIWDIETGNVVKVTNLYGNDAQQPTFERFKVSPTGKYIALIGTQGWMNILSAQTGQWISGAKIDEEIVDICWYGNGSGVVLANKHGDIWEWDVESRSFTKRWKDEGGIGVTKLAMGGKGDRWLAVASNNGIVNVYDRKTIQAGGAETSAFGEPLVYKPRAVLKQLITSITSLEFSPDGQILAMASDQKQNALKLVHIPTFTVFRNWPTANTPLGKVSAVAFTPGGEMLSVGNQAGKARLWRLNHYSS